MIIDSATWDLGYWIEVTEWTRAKRYANGDKLDTLKWENALKKLKMFKKKKNNQKNLSDNMMLTLNIYECKHNRQRITQGWF